MIDLGFNEVSASTGANDTWTTVDIASYPDGSTKTQLHYDSGAGGEVHQMAPKEYMDIDVTFYVLAQNSNAYLDIVLSGGTFATELSGATNATFNTTNIDKLGVGYQMMGIGGNEADNSSDVMLLFHAFEVPIVDDRGSDLVTLDEIDEWL
jgi:hypothetical protein